MRRFLLLLLVVASAFQAWAYKKQSIDITVGGKQRNMVVFTPTKMQEKMPLFIVTHGMNQSPEYQYDSDKMYLMIDTAKFVITYLRSVGNTWNVWGGSEDRDFVVKSIDAMADSFNIDKDRVYWTGFSMGSMLIHSCIGSMQNKIAAFAPTSGIMQGSEPWNSCNKPVNLLEVIAYGDESFKYEEYNIHGYIESYAKHDKHTKYSKTTGYKPISSSWFDGDLEKWTGGANGGEVWLYSYNNGGHWPMDHNRHLIWNFCKRFSLNQPTARITKPAGETTYLCMAPKSEIVFPDVAVTATAKAAKGTITKIDVYDGKTLLDSLKESPYNTTLTAPTAAGKHTLRVVATDSNGKTGETTCMVNFASVAIGSYSLIQTFKVENCVPQNWYVGNGTTKRVGGGLSFTSGNRILRFTNSTKAFEYGLFIQNTANKAKNAWARFGDKSARSHLMLHAGHYAIKYKACNWNCPEFSPITVAVETTSGEEVASQTYTPTVNIGGNVANKFTGVTQQTFEFDIPETGDYVLVFYADAAKNSDFVLGQAIIQAIKYTETTGIQDVQQRSAAQPSAARGCFDLLGRRLPNENLKPGLYVIDGRKVVIK